MKITLQTLAEQLGISTATVSRALKNNRTIHSSTRARVMAAAARLGYDRPSRGTTSTRSDNVRILLLLPLHTRQANTLIFPVYLRGITTASTALGCALSIEEVTEAQSGKMNRRSRLPRALRDNSIDVLLLTGRHHPDDVSVLAQRLPVVSIQWNYPALNIDLVTTFNAPGVSEIVSRLVTRGHRHLAWIGAEYEASFFRERQAGFIQGCLLHDILPEAGSFHTIDKFDAGTLQKLLRQNVTALVAANDHVAVQLAEMCRQQGIRIPEDLGLTGYDGSQRKLDNDKQLMTYDPAFSEVGQAAVQVAVQRIRELGASRMIQSRGGHVVEGDSVRDV